MSNYTYYAPAFEDMNIHEINATHPKEFTVSVPVYPNGDANYAVAFEVDVLVVAPKGYELTDKDYAAIDELLADERPIIHED